jgi:hypothetical protein
MLGPVLVKAVRAASRRAVGSMPKDTARWGWALTFALGGIEQVDADVAVIHEFELSLHLVGEFLCRTSTRLRHCRAEFFVG